MKRDVTHWDEGWSNLLNDADENRSALQKFINDATYFYIKKFIIDKFGSITDLRILEMGCGRGVASAAMALQGANITLLDLSTPALQSAQEFFKNNDLRSPQCISADILNLPDTLLNRFDVVMSFGLVEHFNGKERIDVFKSHLATLRSKGVAVILVPNRLYFPAQIYQFVSERLGTWPYGYERDFTPKELLDHGQRAGFVENNLVGSEFFYDLFSHSVQKLPAFINQVLHRRIRGPVAVNYQQNQKYTLDTQSKNKIWKSPLDPIFGFRLVLLGVKP